MTNCKLVTLNPELETRNPQLVTRNSLSEAKSGEDGQLGTRNPQPATKKFAFIRGLKSVLDIPVPNL